MSRQIDLTKPLSDDDRAYLEERVDVRSLRLNAALMEEADSKSAKSQSSEAVTPAVGDEPPVGAKPNKNASKDTWREWATAFGGMDEGHAASLSRDELAEFDYSTLTQAQ